GPAFVEYPSLHSSYSQGYLNTSGSLTSGSLSVWGSQTWTNPTFSNQTWTNPTRSNQAWTAQSLCSQTWNSQAWNTPFQNFGEDSLQPYMQYQQNFFASDVE
ncbi:hypothetical protein STEG23_013533, partial [Scotinomys teguina]